MKTTNKPPRKSVTETLEWLHANHPDLHAVAELDREWVWIVKDFRGDHNKSQRESIKEFGFKFAIKGHALPSGNLAYWAYSCVSPTRFIHRGKGGKSTSAKPGEFEQEERQLPQEILAAFD